jgi:aconitate hydratase
MSCFPDNDAFGVLREISWGDGLKAHIYSLSALEARGFGALSRLPYAIRVLLECALRNLDGTVFQEGHVRALAAWKGGDAHRGEIPFRPARVILQDFTGIPALVDLAAMREKTGALGGDPGWINPRIPCDLVIDHSVQVDFYNHPEALRRNEEREFERNRERYAFLKWGQQAFQNLRVVPPAMGIVHQVNLEHLCSCVFWDRKSGLAYPDSCLGADSHTTMANGLGVLAWGAGGIEVEAAMLGQAVHLTLPDVVGFNLVGQLPRRATTTDLVLRITEMCRERGVVGKFLEFFGPGVRAMSIPDRATIGNMAPEQGSTVSYFPMDEETLRYLHRTGRPKNLIRLVERYTQEQGLFRTDDAPTPGYSHTVTLDLATIEPCVAGPRRPQDRIALSRVPAALRDAFPKPRELHGHPTETARGPRRDHPGPSHGDVVIAAITSCTNTSNPSVMIAAGLLAKAAVMRGLRVPGHVKTSLAPGSRVVTEYLRTLGLLDALEALGFHIVGYGCTTCIGNSGPLPEAVADAIRRDGLVVAAVLSGNRNFEGRIHPLAHLSLLASPPLVVAYALAGSVDVDLSRDPLGTDPEGSPVHLQDIWPDPQEVARCLESGITREMFKETYRQIWQGSEPWRHLTASGSLIYPWDPTSTYVRCPPFFEAMAAEAGPIRPLLKARVLGLFGDSITTDHISPAGTIAPDSPAAFYLLSEGVPREEWNTYGSRRGNHEVMVRGTFANPRFRNLLVPEGKGPLTVHHPSGETVSYYEAAMRYRKEAVPLIVMAGKEYGAGSSRDWAAKGPFLLGVRAVFAEGFERIHRSNLIGLGILPLEFLPGESARGLGLTGMESYDIFVGDDTAPGAVIPVKARAEGREIPFGAQLRIESIVEKETYRNGGILHDVLRRILREGAASPRTSICVDNPREKG